ncbi:protein FAR1-RELATED SEQUENCE 5-like [Rhododendron vialii]|uniref:protein FAR1-RELATED SEQUENCE 5-like n=1 Tax=Rhododendron vialii TaxID=182163 RepID=UPI00265D9E8C|nr:protein FAR1-RELATED SEQUENCE 5-like [Rhododendron vialii]
MVQALFDELGKWDFSFDVERDRDVHLTHLFFAHPSSIALTKSYPYVFAMDCTYKTNKYKMPLLDIVGVSSFNGSFYSCFAFMQKEEEGDYVWALERFKKLLGHDQQPLVILSDRELALMNAIQLVFPRTAHVLCVWHIEKNVLSKCKSQFESGKDWETFLSTWTNVIESVDESSFHEAWHLLEVQYKEKEYVINYLKNTWLPFKERFFPQTKIASEKLRVTHKFQIPMLKELVSHVSFFALGELFKQCELAWIDYVLGLCTGHFSRTMGLPCAHMMRDKKDGTLLLDDIHPQWRIDRSFIDMDGGVDTNGSEIASLLKRFHDKYKQMPLAQKEDSHMRIAKLVDGEIPLTLEPNIHPHKGRPLGSKKRKRDSSTTSFSI